jgi:2-methylcitrate dehydratase
VAPLSSTWASRLAGSLEAAFVDVPQAILDRAALALLDALACAAGAHDADPVIRIRRTVAGSGPPVATLLFAGAGASAEDAVLVNGTAIRYLDANDIFLGRGPGGHPSDNIPVALAVGEQSGASGRDVLAAIAVGYELTWRLRNDVYRALPRGSDWHEVSISATVASAMAALLYGANQETLRAALCIGAAKGYTLKETRRGEISMLKAVANAMVARDGVLAARLAVSGITGPPRVFEGESGLVATLGGEPDEQMVAALCAPPDWVIQGVSIKPFPALGTSQAAISAAVGVFRQHGPLDPAEVTGIRVSLPDTPWAHDYLALAERRAPATRETADHSIHFLVALALRDGDVTPAQYAAQRWRDADVLALIDKMSFVVDRDVLGDADDAFPAAIEVVLRGGTKLERRVVDTPGSPRRPWGREEVLDKFARLDRTGGSDRSRRAIADATLGLGSAPDLGELMGLVA